MQLVMRAFCWAQQKKRKKAGERMQKARSMSGLLKSGAS
jgi:hypothetical protein